MINFELATNDQLMSIVNKDKDCPPHLLSGAALEMINRNLFDKLIIKTIRSVFCIEVVEQIHKVGLDDFLQISRMRVWESLESFNPQKNKFTTFVYMIVKHEMMNQINKLQAEKRDSRKVISYQTKIEDGAELEVYIEDKKTNVERYVINKVTLEHLISQVNNHQRTVLYYHMKGYTFKEIAVLLGRGSESTMSQAYNLALKKMRKGA